MTQAEYSIKSVLDGHFWRICMNTGKVLCKKVPKNFIPIHIGPDYSRTGWHKRRQGAKTHRNPKRELSPTEFEIVRKFMSVYSNMDKIHREMNKVGHKVSNRAVCNAVRYIRAENGK